MFRQVLKALRLLEAGFRWPDFITGIVRPGVTCVITARAG
jgi:hypothetical protein